MLEDTLVGTSLSDPVEALAGMLAWNKPNLRPVKTMVMEGIERCQPHMAGIGEIVLYLGPVSVGLKRPVPIDWMLVSHSGELFDEGDGTHVVLELLDGYEVVVCRTGATLYVFIQK